MKITEEQKTFLENEFVCERLSEGNNKDLLDCVENKVNQSLVDYFKHPNAQNQDRLNELACYVIKDKSNKIAFLFSLQTGCLFDSRDSILERENRCKILNMAIAARKDLDSQINVVEAERFLKSVNLIALNENQLHAELNHVTNVLANKRKDLILERNPNVYHVVNTYPSVELHLFCKNDLYKDDWKSFAKRLNFPSHRKMGEIFFWHFVVDKVAKVQEAVGCKYMYLFAADHPVQNSAGGEMERRSLVSYYNLKLKFARTNKLATIKPSFDYACVFMCQDINFLKRCKANFFDEFNKIEEAF